MPGWQNQVISEIEAVVRKVAEEHTAMWDQGYLMPDWHSCCVAEGFEGVQHAEWYEEGRRSMGRGQWLREMAESAARDRGQGIRWTVDEMMVMPRSPQEAVVAYQVKNYMEGNPQPAQALFLETWVKQQGKWHLRRHTAEFAAPVREG